MDRFKISLSCRLGKIANLNRFPTPLPVVWRGGGGEEVSASRSAGDQWQDDTEEKLEEKLQTWNRFPRPSPVVTCGLFIPIS